MSLINKMLQDLDARGSTAGADLPPEIRAAAVSERRLPRKQVVIAASALTVCAAVAVVIWLKLPAPVSTIAPQTVAAAVSVPQSAAPAAPVAAPGTAALPPKAQAPSALVANTAPPPVINTQAPLPPVAGPKAAAAPADASSPAFEAPAQDGPKPALAQRRVRAAPAQVDVPSASPRAVPPLATVGGREQTVAQRSENFYRQALGALDEGRVSAAYTAFDQALKLNPRHDAARQSLVGLLIEDGRTEEAMQQLEQGLAADASQTSLAMLLARMQIERGSSGVATLLRTLPSAAGNADYHAFLAGALQREGRHKEAVEQYAAALRITPEQGVWLMGLGISLQGEQRNRDAAEAFRRARASGMLTPALDAFVERKLQQLTP